MEICTIGSSGSSAEAFFLRLEMQKVTALIDTRANPNSQLGGFAKSDSLKFFLPKILAIPYVYEALLIPSKGILKSYRNGEISWAQYANDYQLELQSRLVVEKLDTSNWGTKPVLLCSEKLPDNCHRRLAAEYLSSGFNDVSAVIHL